MRRSSTWGTIVTVGVIVGGLLWLISTVGKFVTTYRNPLDQNWVTDVVTDPYSGKHAVVAKYHDGNSSTTSMALWIIEGDAPEIGSTDLLDGRPIALWWGLDQVRYIAWSKRGRVVLTVARSAEIIGNLGHFCFYGSEMRNSICASPEIVDIVLAPENPAN
jgi:hypothetical protein